MALNNKGHWKKLENCTVDTPPGQHAKEFLGYLLEGLRGLRLLQPPDIVQPWKQVS